MRRSLLKNVLNKIAAQNVDSPKKPEFEPLELGSCCYSAEVAQDLGFGCGDNETQAQCEQFRGSWDRKRCDQRDCDLEVFPGDNKGACCLGNNCQFLTEEECSRFEGSYQGDFSRCDEGQTANKCLGEEIKGACCGGPGQGNDGCSETSYRECAEEKFGYWQGAGTTCEGADCGGAGQDIGACCRHVTGQDQTECTIKSRYLCAYSNGAFAGKDTVCEDQDCAEAMLGSCCVSRMSTRRNVCIPGVTRMWCDDFADPRDGISTVFNGPGSNCSEADCREYFDPLRPCCKEEGNENLGQPISWSCKLRGKKECEQVRGTWHENARTCGEVDCSGQGWPTGASLKSKLTESLRRLNSEN